MKICRVTKRYLREGVPGVALPSFYLTQYVREPTLVITGKETYAPAGGRDGVRVAEIAFPDAPFPERRCAKKLFYRWNYFRVLLVKAAGMAVFFLKSLPHVIRFRPDIMHVHAVAPLLQGLFAKYFLSSRCVVSIHGSELLHIKRSFFLRWLMRHPDLVLYVSRSMKDDLAQFVPAERLAYLGNGVDTSLFRYAGRKTKQIIAVGRWRWQKGPDCLMEALEDILAVFPDYRAVIVGDGPLRRRMEKRAHDAGLSERIYFAGTVHQEKLAGLLSESKLFLMSSVSEGFPKVLIESIACQTPVVVTDTGSCKEVAEGEKVGIAVETGNARALSGAAVKILRNETLWDEFFTQCRTARGHYTWNAVARRAHAAYTQVREPAGTRESAL